MHGGTQACGSATEPLDAAPGLRVVLDQLRDERRVFAKGLVDSTGRFMEQTRHRIAAGAHMLHGRKGFLRLNTGRLFINASGFQQDSLLADVTRGGYY